MSAFVLSTALLLLPPALAQNNATLKGIEAQFYPEQGCPVEITSMRSVLEIDPFGAPIASRVYITYKNNSTKPVKAVKFRIRYVDASGKNLGTFHAPDGSPLAVSPGGSRANKWRKAGGLHPDIASFKVRVFKVRFSDGSQWESIRAQQIEADKNSEGATGQSFTGSGGDQFSTGR